MTDQITFGEPKVEYDTDSLMFTWHDGNGEEMLRTLFENLHEKDNGLFADITVWYLVNQPLGVRPVQPTSTLKLNSSHSTGWRSIPRELDRIASYVQWEPAMRMAVNDTMEWFKNGSPIKQLGEAAEFNEPFILKPFIANSGVTVMYGEGGLSKSLVSLAMAISVSTGVPIFGAAPLRVGPVVIFDYEDDATTHNVRMHAICRAFGIPLSDTQVYHFPLAVKVVSAKQIMRAKIKETGAILGILDSVGMGRGGSAIAAEDTIRMFRALRAISVPFLAIDHVSKEAKADKSGDVDAYGSIYTMNSARLAWSLSRQLIGSDANVISMYAQNTKANHVSRQRPKVIQVTYVNDSRGIPERINIEMSNDFGMMQESVDLIERIKMLLSDGMSRTDEMISESLGAARNSVRQAITRAMAASAQSGFTRSSDPGQEAWTGWIMPRTKSEEVLDGA